MSYLLYFLLVFLTTYTDTPLTAYLGAFGFSALPLLSFIMYPCLLMFSKKKVIYPPFSRFLYKLVNYTLAISFFVMLVFLVLGLPMNLYGDNAVNKTIKLYMTFLSYVLFLICMVNLMFGLNTKQLLRPFFLIFIALTIFGLLENSQIPYAFPWLHATGDGEYWRVRLLCQEASHTSPILSVFFLLSLYYSIFEARKKSYVVITLSCLVVHAIISSSKLFMVIILVSSLIGAWTYIRKISGTKKFLGIVISFFLLLYLKDTIFVKVAESFQGDIDNSTSTATRMTTNFSGYVLGCMFPVGAGFFSYLYLLPKALSGIVQYLPNYFNVSELMAIINAKDDSGLAAQSFFSQSSIYWGAVGSVLLLKKIKDLFANFTNKHTKEKVVVIKVLYWAIMIHLFISTGLDFVFLTVFSFLIADSYKTIKF